MRFFPTLLVSAFACILGFTPLAHSAETPSAGVAMLRTALENTDNDVERNHKIRQALPLLRRDAIAGDAKAQYNLARLYETGVPSGPGPALLTFPARSYAWYVSAARLGHPLAIKRLEATGGANTTNANATNPDSETAETPAPLSKDDKAAMGLGGSYQLTIASFRNRANAAALVEILTEEGIIAMAHHRTDAQSGEWHVVKSAPVFSRAGAEALREGLKRNFGVDPQIKELDPAP